jgi:hypothetical protein
MNDHERDLILALTEGSLSDEEAGAALARVTGDPELAIELSTQQSVAAILADLPEPELTVNERSHLRAALIEELHLTREPTAEVVPIRRGARWWQPVLGVAAVAAVVTAVVVLPGNLGGDESAEVATLKETGSSSAVTTTIAAGAADDGAAGGAAEEGAASDAPVQNAELLTIEDVDGEELLAATEGETTPEGVTRALGEQAPAPTTLVPIDEIEACLEALATRLPKGETQPVALDARTEGDLLYLTVDPGDGVQAVVTIRLDTCTLVEVTR